MPKKGEELNAENGMLISFRVGTKKDLDKQVINILKDMDNKEKTEYIKRAVVDYFEKNCANRDALIIESLNKVTATLDVLYNKMSNLTINAAVSPIEAETEEEETKTEEIPDNVFDDYLDFLNG